MKSKEKLRISDFKPIAVLALITAVTTILLVVMERSIQADETELSGSLKEMCIEMMGEGEFIVITDWDMLSRVTPEIPREINRTIIHEESGTVAFQIIVNGYNRNGLNLLIVMNGDGSVKDLAVYINTETPSIGTKVNERSFLDNFIGRSEDVRVVRGTSRSENEIAAITGATVSSRAVADAVNIAVYAYDLIYPGGWHEQES
ncbi:MAG: FMN-binding protein [Oscillospiraceae bacterium]|nr:FMN-binding protein [Oscillospiraceae bacterium]